MVQSFQDGIHVSCLLVARHNSTETVKKLLENIVLPVMLRGDLCIEWYAKRPKSHALLNEFNHLDRQLVYCDENTTEEKIQNRSDAWNATSYFCAMDTVEEDLAHHGITKFVNDLK